MKLRENVIIFLVFLLFSIILSWPLLIHIDGFLLHNSYEDISFSDTHKSFDHLQKTIDLIENRKNPMIIDNDEVPLTYTIPGALLTYIPGVTFVVYHNFFFIICIFLSGFFTFLLVFEISKDKLSALFAGILYMSSNYLMHQYMWGHNNYMQIHWIPIIFLFIERTINYKSIDSALFLGLFFSFQVYSSSQYTVYLTFIIPIYLLLRTCFVDNKFLISKSFWFKILISFITALLLTIPYLMKRLSIYAPIRTISDNQTNYWVLDSLIELISVNSNISIGLIPIILTLIGVYLVLRSKSENRYDKYMPFILLAIFLIMAMGGTRFIWSPYHMLYWLWPYVNKFRVPQRLFPFLLLSVSVIASLPLLHFFRNKTKRFYYLCVLIIFLFISHILVSPWLSNRHIFFP